MSTVKVRRAAGCESCGSPRSAAVHHGCAEYKRWRTAVFRYGREVKINPEAVWHGPKSCSHTAQEHHEFLTVAERERHERLKGRIRAIWLGTSDL
jgi:hypothetical protein